MIDTRRALEVGEAAAAVDVPEYVNSACAGQGILMKLATLNRAATACSSSFPVISPRR